MIKISDRRYEWVLLHIRNGEVIAGLCEVPEHVKEDSDSYKSQLAHCFVQSKEIIAPFEVMVKDRLIEVRNPNHVVMQAGNGKQVLSVMPMMLGDRVIYLRSAEILFLQFLDDTSPIVVEIRKGMTGLAMPNEGETRTQGGIIVPGGPQA